VRIASAAARFNVRIDRVAASANAAGARSNLIAVPTMPVPSGLVRNNTSPGRAPALESTRAGSIAPATAYPNLTSGSCTVWPPRKRHTRLAEHVESAGEDRANRFDVERVFRERRDRKRRQRHAAHSVDVAQRVGGGDLAVHVRVVDDRREEVDRLDQRRSALP